MSTRGVSPERDAAASSWAVRRDELDEAHRAWLRHLARPGTWWTGSQRVAFVRALWDALDDPDPLPPWVLPSTTGRARNDAELPGPLLDLAYRLSLYAATMTADRYRNMVAWLATTEPAQPREAYVELAGIAAMGAAVGTFAPALGLARPALPEPRPGAPTRYGPPTVAAVDNWVPVTAPADTRAAVVQALSAVPAEFEQLWLLGDVQYMPEAEMGQLDWRRPGSPLHRRQIELVAARVSIARECFY